MKKSLIGFENSLKQIPKEDAKKQLEELSFELALKELRADRSKLNELLNQFVFIAKEAGFCEPLHITTIIQAILKASVEDEKKELFLKLAKQDELEKEIIAQKERIKHMIKTNFKLLEQNVKNQGLLDDDFVNDIKLCEIEILGILKETAESAYLTTLEKAQDIELTSKEITRSLIYNAINEGSFEKKRIISISNVVLEAAFELANESKLYAEPLCLGAIWGAWDAIADGVLNFRSSFAHCELAEDIKLKEKELIYIEDDFIFLLRFLASKNQSPVKEILDEILSNKLDSISAKFSRSIQESKEELLLKLNELKQNPKVYELSEQAKNKLSSIKQDLSNLDLDAKELGLRLWQRAKTLIKKK